MSRVKIFSSLILSFILLASYVVNVNAQSRFYGQPTPTPIPVAKNSLTQVQLRSCQARESAVKNRMESLVNLVANMEKKFDAIAQRVKDYYNNKVASSGKTVSNYSSLLADIDAKKEVVQKDLTSVQEIVNKFSCTSDDPKGLLTQFRLKMQTVKKDLHSYRTSIKNLIVAVRSVSPTPEASASPKEGK